MLDPFPIPPPPWLVSAIKPFADTLNLHTLPLHAHEILFALAIYTFTASIISPRLSTWLFPKIYPGMSKRGKVNWDVHIVSFAQALIINGLSLYIIWFDEERKEWRRKEEWQSRVWGYYGSGGLAQSFALGYFLWDLCMCAAHIDVFGVGMLAHAVSAVAVFGLGYRPYIYFSAPIFLLYELSSPFLNIHWFCDKLDLTGSTLQAINGVFLVTTFFSCRLVWGVWNSVLVFQDMWKVLMSGGMNYAARVATRPSGRIHTYSTAELLQLSRDPQRQLHAFNSEEYIPLWLPLIYLASNLVLNSLNIFWFGKMIQTIRTRFPPPYGTKGVEGKDKILYNQTPDSADSSSSETDKNKKDESIRKQKPRRRSVAEMIQDELDDDSDSDLGVGAPGKEKVHADGRPHRKKGSVKAAREKAEKALNKPVGKVEDTKVERVVYADDHHGVQVTGTSGKGSVRSRRKA